MLQTCSKRLNYISRSSVLLTRSRGSNNVLKQGCTFCSATKRVLLTFDFQDTLAHFKVPCIVQSSTFPSTSFHHGKEANFSKYISGDIYAFFFEKHLPTSNEVCFPVESNASGIALTWNPQDVFECFMKAFKKHFKQDPNFGEGVWSETTPMKHIVEHYYNREPPEHYINWWKNVVRDTAVIAFESMLTYQAIQHVDMEQQLQWLRCLDEQRKNLSLDSPLNDLVTDLFDMYGSSAVYQFFDDVVSFMHGVSERYVRENLESAPKHPVAVELVIGIISNNDPRLHAVVEQLTRRHSPSLHFDFVLTSVEAKLLKPDKRIFQLAQQLDPEWKAFDQCIHVGNHSDTDVNGAINAGFLPVLIDRTQSLASWTPNVIRIQRLEELFDIIEA